MTARQLLNPKAAAAIARGVERRQVIDQTAAEQYATRITVATHGQAEAESQMPFHATQDGDLWWVRGSKPASLATMSGPLTIAIARHDGSVRDLFYTAAPAGWDAELQRASHSGH